MITPTSEIREEIREINEQFETAFAGGDAAAIAVLYGVDAELLPPGAEVVDGRAGIEHFWQTILDLGIRELRLETVELEMVGDVAVEIGHYALSTPAGQLANRGKYMVLWRREDGRWHLNRSIWNSSVPTLI